MIEQVLSEVHELLELYSPTWYGEEIRERMLSALNRAALADNSKTHPCP